MYGRHHALRDCVFDAARSANQRPWREIGVDSSGQRPADCFLPNWSHGRPLAIDVTVSHPSQSRISINAREGLSASEHASVVKAEEKDRRYLDLCARHGVDFLPLVICAYGGFLGPVLIFDLPKPMVVICFQTKKPYNQAFLLFDLPKPMDGICSQTKKRYSKAFLL